MTTQSIESLAHDLAGTLREGLLGVDPQQLDINLLKDLLTRKLKREVKHSRVTSPLVAKRGQKTYTISYFMQRLDREVIIWLVGIYEAKVLPVLRDFYVDLLDALIYAHVADGQLSYDAYEAKKAQYKELSTYLANRN